MVIFDNFLFKILQFLLGEYEFVGGRYNYLLVVKGVFEAA